MLGRADLILRSSLEANEGHIGVNQSILSIMKVIGTQMNVNFLQANSERCNGYYFVCVFVGFFC